MNFMEEALKEAKKSYHQGDVPVGAIIVKNQKIISKGHNKKEKMQVATRHAEMIAIEKACKKLKTWHLDDCILYVTMEPCLMCAGAILQSRIKKIVYAVPNAKFGFIESIENIIGNPKNNHNAIIEKGNLENEIKEMLITFFRQKRK